MKPRISSLQGKEKKWTGWRLKKDEAKIEFQKAVTDPKDDKQEENLVTIQKDLEEAAGKVARSTKKTTETKPCKKHRRKREYVNRQRHGAQK